MNAPQLLRIALVSCLLLLLGLPVVADGATELSDTLYVIKEGEALSNVEVAPISVHEVFLAQINRQVKNGTLGTQSTMGLLIA